MDYKALLTNPYLLAAGFGGLGAYVGPKYINKHGRLIGVAGGAVAGYLLAKLLAPKVVAPTPEQLAAQAQQTQQAAQQQAMQDYVDIDIEEDIGMPQRRGGLIPKLAPVPRPAQSPYPPRVDDLSDLSDLSADWAPGASYQGGLGSDIDDQELERLVRQGKRGN